MDVFTVAVVSLGAGLIVVVGGGLIFYMSALVRSAYQLKMDMQQQLDDGLTRAQEEMDKRAKFIKRELVDEIEKIRSNMLKDMATRLDTAEAALLKRQTEFEEKLQADRDLMMRLLEGLKGDLVTLDQRTKALRRDLRREVETQVAVQSHLTGSPPSSEPEPAPEIKPAPAEAPAAEA